MKAAIIILSLISLLFAKTQIVLNDSSAVAGEFITLGNIAEIKGEYKDMLDTMFVATAAPAGHSRFLMKTSISLPAHLKDKIEISGKDRIKIHSLSQKISFEELARKANELLRDSITNNENITSEILFAFNDSAAINIPLGKYSIELGKIDKSQLRGRVLVPLVVISKNGKKTRASINATVKTVASVCVATRNITREDRFAPQFLKRETVDISTLTGTPLFAMPELDEYMVIGAIRKGTVITNRHIAPKPLIAQGTPVKMTTGEGTVKIQIWGRARAAGRIGDVIAVENIESNKIVRAKIVSAELVEIVRGGTI